MASKTKRNIQRTPDGRYVVVNGRLWRCTNPQITPEEVRRLTQELMDARRSVAAINRGEPGDLSAARSAINQAKIALGERGPVWWSDGQPDYNRHMAWNTPYSDWYASVEAIGD